VNRWIDFRLEELERRPIEEEEEEEGRVWLGVGAIVDGL